jgi:hypothetical protein
MWQREGHLFGSYDDPSLPGDRLCVETHNVYHHDCVVQVGPFHVEKRIYLGHYHPPMEEDYAQTVPQWGVWRTLCFVVGVILLGLGIGFLLPV